MSENETISQTQLEEEIFNTVRDVLDFPKAGVLFKDINPVFQNHRLSKKIIKHLGEYYAQANLDAVVGIESRGFFFGFPLALELNIPFIPIRKKGKLPGDVLEQAYDLEYGKAIIEVQRDTIESGMNVLVHDDVLATGGTANAAAQLVHKCGGHVHGFNFIIELAFLNGGENLKSTSSNIYNLAVAKN
ncbi:MAG: adenine phosphoribosyltransferase [Flavobacteriales bacterium]